MVWEAIERYLSEVEKEVNHTVDQRVPQLTSELDNIMLNSEIRMDTYYAGCNSEDELYLGSRPLPVAVENLSPEQTISREDVDILVLDDSSLYPDTCTTDNSLKSTHDNLESNFMYNEESNRVNIENPAFRPVTIKNEYHEKSCNINTTSDFYPADVCELFRSQAFNACVMDVHNTCSSLSIPSDPRSWSPEQVQQWIVCQCKEFNVPQPDVKYFYFTGEELCSLKEDYFRYYAPESSSTLLSRLEIWKNVNEQTTFMGQQTTQSFTPQVTQIPVPRSPTLSPVSGPSISSMSPSPTFTDDDSLPSTPPYCKPEEVCDRLPEEPAHHHRQTIQLWQFLKLLLLDGNYTDCIRWLDRQRGIFKIENSTRVAKLWGKRKNRPAMNYDKLSRSIRQYYKKNIIKKTEHSKRLVYQFCQI